MGKKNGDDSYDDDPFVPPECVAESATVQRVWIGMENFTHTRNMIKHDADWNEK
jgi:hypothetical protein